MSQVANKTKPVQKFSNWQQLHLALEAYVKEVAMPSWLSFNQSLETFLSSRKTRMVKSRFPFSSQAIENLPANVSTNAFQSL